MKKLIFFSIIVLIFLFLNGCVSQLEKPIYECVVKGDSSIQGCGNIGNREHMCQIYDASYNPSKGMPDFCTDFCLKRSNLKSEISEECIIIEVRDSSFNENITEKSVYVRQAEGFIETYEYENSTDSQTCEPNSSESCCIDAGKCWINNSCQPCSVGTCQFESDCPDICEGTILWKQWCNLNRATCEKTSPIDCSKENMVIGEKSFSKVCSSEKCVLDITELKEYKQEITNEYNELTIARQKINELSIMVDDIAITSAANITTQTLSQTFELLNAINGSWVKIITEQTINLVGEGLSIVGKGDTSSTTQADTLVWALKSRDKLKNELAIIDVKQNELFVKQTEVVATINSLENK
jgi:hypothetical protein